MSAFLDDFYDDNLFSRNTIEAMLNRMPHLQADYDAFMVYYKDLEGAINNQIYLTTIAAYMPVREINIMIEIINAKRKLRISKYGIYRDCEDYLVKTPWFFSLTSTQQFKIRFDFYANIVLGIHHAYFRV